MLILVLGAESKIYDKLISCQMCDSIRAETTSGMTFLEVPKAGLRYSEAEQGAGLILLLL